MRCDTCNGVDEGNTCCVDMPLDAEARYLDRVCAGPSCAIALLDYWERDWSPRAKRFACNALYRALVRGIDVLEASGLR